VSSPFILLFQCLSSRFFISFFFILLKANVPMGTGGSFPGGKARPGRDADHSPQSSAEVKNE
jgi:hypothetical protein